FALAVLDFNMPEMNGAELARAIRERPAQRALAIVMLSSADGEERAASARSQSFALLSKPVRREDLRVAIVAALAAASEGTRASGVPFDTDSAPTRTSRSSAVTRS